MTPDISRAVLTDVDHRYHEETNESVRTTPTPAQNSPLPSAPRSSLAGQPSAASTFSGGNQDPPLLYLADDGLLSPIRPTFPTRHSARHPSELSPTTPASNTSRRSLSEGDLGRRCVPGPRITIYQDNPASLGDPVTCLHKKTFSVNLVREDASTTDHSHADGSSRNDDSLEECVETEIDDLLQVMTDNYSKGGSTMSIAPLLPPPEESSPIGSRPYSDHSFPPLLPADALYNCDSDTPSLTSSSPSLKSKRSFTPITPTTDGWRSPPTLLTVPEHRGDLASDNHHLCVLREDRRVRDTNLPPLRTMIPEVSTVERWSENPIPSEHTLPQDRGHRVETSIDRIPPSHFSNDTPESTEIGYIGSDIEPECPSTAGTVPSQIAQPLPRLEVPQGPGSDSNHGGHSPAPSINPGFIVPPSVSNGRRSPAPKRSAFRTIFSQNSVSGRKKERKQEEAQDPIQTQSPAARSIETASVTSTSSKSSKDKDRKKGEKAARRAQLAEQLKAKQPARAMANSRRDPAKPSTTWEEKGGMYGVDVIFLNSSF